MTVHALAINIIELLKIMIFVLSFLFTQKILVKYLKTYNINMLV